MFGRFAPSSKKTSRFRLDPFGFWPGAASAIGGLGGTAPSDDPTAVFHTSYTPYPAGPITFDVEIRGLRASRGTLALAVVAIGDDEAEPKTQQIAEQALAELAAEDGRHRLRIVARTGWLYAVIGRVTDDTDATADELLIDASRQHDATLFERRLAAARVSLFQTGGEPAGLIVDRPATLADPRSQMCTAAQFDEPDYARWLGLMNRAMHRHRKQWEYVFIGRTLEHMEALRPLGRGLGFGCGHEPLPATFAAMNIFVTASDLASDDERATDWRATAQHTTGLTDLRDPTICPDHVFDARVEFQAVDMRSISPHLREYDFCWSSCALEHLGSIDEGLRFIERSLDTLRPGGVAVHTTELNLTSNRRTVSSGGTVLFRRRDIEGLAVRLRERGHNVVPITFDQGDQPEDRHVDLPPYSTDHHLKLALGQFVSTSFGLVVRRGG